MSPKMQHYLELPYAVEIVPDEGGFLASIPDLPGCMSSGETAESALQGLQQAKELWFEGRLESGEPIPEPSDEGEYSGKFVLRLPRSLHRELDLAARRDGISLNQYILRLLAERHQLSQVQGMIRTLVREPSEHRRVMYYGMDSSGGTAHHFREACRGMWTEARDVSQQKGQILSVDHILGNIQHVPKPPSGKRAFKQIFQPAFTTHSHGK